MIVTETVPATGEKADAATSEGKEWLRRRYQRDSTPFVRVNMITTLTGSAFGSDGTSNTITSRTDRTILGRIRAEADVVLVGAATVRAEGLTVPRSRPLAVVSASGNLGSHPLQRPGAEEQTVFVITPEGVRPPEVGIHVPVSCPSGTLEPAAIVQALRERGMNRIVCEGGPTLAGQFASAGIIDEYCVSVAPVLVAAPTGPFLPVPGTVTTELIGALVDEDGFSYLRLRALQ